MGAVHVVSVTGNADFAPTRVAVTILGGALVQYPIGIASDRVDRRHVLAFICVMRAASQRSTFQAQPLALRYSSMPQLLAQQVTRCTLSRSRKLQITHPAKSL